MAFAKYHLPCPDCGGSDPVSINEDGSGYCFSCKTRFKNYEESCDGSIDSTLIDIKPYRNNTMNYAEGEFLALTDRGISLNSAKTLGVKAVTNFEGKIIKHL